MERVAGAAEEEAPGQAGGVEDDSREARWARRAEAPLALVSLIFLASYAVWVLAHGLSDTERAVCPAVLLAAWAVFVVDYAVRPRLSGQGPGFVRTHWLDTPVIGR
jgi:voltage-gated potassium channel